MTWLQDQYTTFYQAYIPSYTQRLQVIINTDKVVYRPNDVIFIEVLVLNALNKTPIALDPTSYYFYNYYLTLDIFDPTQSSIQKDYGYAQNSTASFTYKIPSTATGGQYMISVGSSSIPAAYKIISVQDYPRPQLIVAATLDQDSYYPGNTVNVKVTVQTLDGSAFTDSPTFSYSVQFENQTIQQSNQQLSQQGQAYFSFIIPQDTTLLFTSIAVIAQYGTIQQAHSTTLVLGSTDQLTIDFFPETGFYVKDLINSVYFQAYTDDSRYDVVDFKGAQIIAYNVSSGSKNPIVLIQSIDTLHKGKGVFNFTPSDSLGNYSLQVYLGVSKNPKVLYFYQNVIPIQYSISSFYPMPYTQNEINFRIVNPHKVLANTDDLIVQFYPNSQLIPTDVYLFTISLKEQILYQITLSFNTSQLSTLVINSQNFTVINGGTLQAQLYKMSSQIIVYAQYLNANGYNKDQGQTYNTQSSGGIYYGGGIKVPSPVIKGDNINKQDLNIEQNIKKPKPSSSSSQQDNQQNTFTNSTRPDIISWRQPKGEILFFVKPSTTLMLQITTDKQIYAPGQQVYFAVKVIERSTQIVKTNVDTYVSIVVTDDSVFNRIEDKLQPPTFASAIYLAYDVLNSNYQFENANYYLEHIFNPDTNSLSQSSYQYSNSNYSNDLNLELLLSIQQWRYGVFDVPYLQSISQNISSLSDEQQAQIQSLYSYQFNTPKFFKGGFGGIVPMNVFGPLPAPAPPNAEIKTATASTTTSSQGPTVQQQSLNTSLFDTSIPQDFMTDIKQNTKYYSHSLRPNYNPTLRVDKTETQFYQVAGKTTNGIITGNFYLSDLITEFRMTANAFSENGQIGYTHQLFNTQLPFTVSVSLPQSMTIGDVLQIPVYLNSLLSVSSNVVIQIQSSQSLICTMSTSTVNVKSGSNQVINIKVNATQIDDKAYLFIQASASYTLSSKQQQSNDSQVVYTKIIPHGFPKQFSKGGFIGISQSPTISSQTNFTLSLPSTLEPSSFKFQAKIISSNFAQLLEAVQALISQPNGCFEQTSATTYPMVMALSFLQGLTDQTQQVIDMQTKILQLLKPGYTHLLTFQTSQKGYEWFGQTPSHEALTAYGLMQFSEMNKVTNFVDQNMINQATNWLLQRKDGKGGFLRSTQALDSFGRAPTNITNAYIVWALSSSGYTNLTDEINNLTQTADSSIQDNNIDTYFLGLVSASLFNLNQSDKASIYADIIVKYQLQTGNVTNSQTSITASQGQNLMIETTSIACIAWLSNQNRYGSNIENGINWIVQQVQRGGSYGSTQATILALKAITTYMNTFVNINGKGTFVLKVNNQDAQSLAFSSDNKESLIFDISSFIQSNPNLFQNGQSLTFTLSIQDYVPDSQGSNSDFKVSYSMEASYSDSLPISSNQSIINFNVQQLKAKNAILGSTSMMGQVFTYNFTLTNLQKLKGIGMTLAIFRLPSCLSFNFPQLDTLLGNKVFDKYEVRYVNGQELVLYWRQMIPQETKIFQMGFIQEFSGYCYQKPNTAYQYYNDDTPVWTLTNY